MRKEPRSNNKKGGEETRNREPKPDNSRVARATLRHPSSRPSSSSSSVHASTSEAQHLPRQPLLLILHHRIHPQPHPSHSPSAPAAANPDAEQCETVVCASDGDTVVADLTRCSSSLRRWRRRRRCSGTVYTASANADSEEVQRRELRLVRSRRGRVQKVPYLPCRNVPNANELIVVLLIIVLSRCAARNRPPSSVPALTSSSSSAVHDRGRGGGGRGSGRCCDPL